MNYLSKADIDIGVIKNCISAVVLSALGLEQSLWDATPFLGRGSKIQDPT